MPEDKTPFIEIHDAHVTAALDNRNEQHFRWMMAQEKPEVGTDGENYDRWLDDVWQCESQLRELALGPSQDVARNQMQAEKVGARLEKLKAIDPFTYGIEEHRALFEDIPPDCRSMVGKQVDRAAGNEIDGATIQKARELLPKIEELWSLILAGDDNPLKLRTADDLRKVAIDILDDDPSKWLPIEEEHLRTPSLYNTAPDRAGAIFERNLLSVVLKNQGYQIRNKKQLLKDAKTTL